jgi:hypothetical protein
VGATSGDAACGRARFDAVDEKEIMQPLESMQMELCLDACRVVFSTRVCQEGRCGG